jgi:MFS family permease
MDVQSDRPARFLWLPPSLRPPAKLPHRQEVVFLLVGITILFSGYDLNVFGLALPQIQRSLHIPEDAAGLTATYFRLATVGALLIAPLADLLGRRTLLLATVFGEALFTLFSAFAPDYVLFVSAQIAARVFGYCEELLCFVVIAEEMDEGARGWSIGMLGAMNATGAGVASLVFALVDVLPFGWRALYATGGAAFFVLGYYRSRLPETRRFELRRQELETLGSKTSAGLSTLARLVNEHPVRLATMLLAVGALGFAVAPAALLMPKYLQDVEHFRPWQVTLLYVFGGFLSVVGNAFVGRLSDRWGRRTVIMACVFLCGAGFAIVYCGAAGIGLIIAWIIAIFGYLSSDALLAGYPAEIFPTAYRATTATLRYTAAVLAGALSLGLEGMFYDWFGAHGPAIALPLTAAPIAILAIHLLPEAAGKTLEEIG